MGSINQEGLHVEPSQELGEEIAQFLIGDGGRDGPAVEDGHSGEFLPAGAGACIGAGGAVGHVGVELLAVGHDEKREVGVDLDAVVAASGIAGDRGVSTGNAVLVIRLDLFEHGLEAVRDSGELKCEFFGRHEAHSLTVVLEWRLPVAGRALPALVDYPASALNCLGEPGPGDRRGLDGPGSRC